MKRLLSAIGVMTLLVLLVGVFSEVSAAPTVTITLQNPAPGGLLELEVGETYTFEIHITSDEPFLVAMAMTDDYYPGRGVIWRGGDRTNHDTTAVLYLTMTGRESTAYLPAVCDWPEPGMCWPEGVAPVSIVAGARFRRGVAISEEFAFAAEVP